MRHVSGLPDDAHFEGGFCATFRSWRCQSGTTMMMRDYWKVRERLANVIPPVLVRVPGSMLGIEVPFLPQPGRLHIVVPYEADRHVDPVAMAGMRWACCIGRAA